MIIKKSEKDERREKIIDVAFRLFVDKKIESVTMGEIAKEAGIGRATLFRYFPGKLELVIAVNTKEWKEYFDELDQKRPMSSVGDIPAIGRLIFTLDSFIEMYQTHKALLRYNDISIIMYLIQEEKIYKWMNLIKHFFQQIHVFI